MMRSNRDWDHGSLINRSGLGGNEPVTVKKQLGLENTIQLTSQKRKTRNYLSPYFVVYLLALIQLRGGC